MVARITTVAFQGIEAVPVDVQVLHSELEEWLEPRKNFLRA